MFTFSASLSSLAQGFTSIFQKKSPAIVQGPSLPLDFDAKFNTSTVAKATIFTPVTTSTVTAAARLRLLVERPSPAVPAVQRRMPNVLKKVRPSTGGYNAAALEFKAAWLERTRKATQPETVVVDSPTVVETPSPAPSSTEAPSTDASSSSSPSPPSTPSSTCLSSPSSTSSPAGSPSSHSPTPCTRYVLPPPPQVRARRHVEQASPTRTAGGYDTTNLDPAGSWTERTRKDAGPNTYGHYYVRKQSTLRAWTRTMTWIVASLAALVLVVICLRSGSAVAPVSPPFASPNAISFLSYALITWIVYGIVHGNASRLRKSTYLDTPSPFSLYPERSSSTSTSPNLRDHHLRTVTPTKSSPSSPLSSASPTRRLTAAVTRTHEHRSTYRVPSRIPRSEAKKLTKSKSKSKVVGNAARFGTLLLIKDKDVAKVVAEVVDPLVRALAYDRRIMCITERDAEPTSGDEVDEAELDALCEGMAAMTCKGINSRVWNWDLGIWWAEHDYQVTVQSWIPRNASNDWAQKPGDRGVRRAIRARDCYPHQVPVWVRSAANTTPTRITIAIPPIPSRLIDDTMPTAQCFHW